MEVSQSHMDWGSVSNPLDKSTMMCAAGWNGAPSDYYRRLLLDEDMTPPDLDDLEQLAIDWELAPDLTWEPSQNLPPMSSEELQLRDEDMTPPDLDDLEQLDWELAPDLTWEPSQNLPSVSSEELQCPPTSHTAPVDFPTADESGESHEMGGQENQSSESREWDRDCSGEATSLPVVPSGEKIGVTFHKKNKQWEAHVWIKGPQLRGRKKKGVQIFLGNFETEEEAKVAHDRAAIKLGMPRNSRGEPYPLNFPATVHASYMEEHAHWTARDFLWKIRRTSNKFTKGKSSLKGVTVRKRSVTCGEEWAAKYESKISLTAQECGVDLKRTFMLGNFDSEEEAGQAYDRALLFVHQHQLEVEQLRCITNYRPSSYSAEEIESISSKLPRLQ